MTLIDPKTYVSLPPGLIYDVDDLERETYKALLQVVGWMWVTRWWEHPGGKSLGTSIPELAGRWQIAERSVYHRLQTLSAKGYLNVQYAPSGQTVSITMGPRALENRPREAATQQAARGGEQATGGGDTTGRERRQTQQAARGGEQATGGGEQAARGGDTTGRERRQTQQATGGDNEHESTSTGSRNQVAPPGGFRASSLHENATISSSSCSELIQESDLKDQQLHTNTPDVAEALRREGVFSDKIDRLSADPWVTEDRIERWVQDIQRQLRQDPQAIRSARAVLCSNLLNHREPPPSPATVAQLAWQRMADALEHRAASPTADPLSQIPQQKLWSSILAELKLVMTQATFHGWLLGSQVVEATDDCWTVAVRADPLAMQDWVHSRLKLQAVIDRHAGRPITITYVSIKEVSSCPE